MSWAGWRGEGAREDGGIWAVSLPHVLSKGEAAASSTPQLLGLVTASGPALCHLCWGPSQDHPGTGSGGRSQSLGP